MAYNFINTNQNISVIIFMFFQSQIWKTSKTFDNDDDDYFDKLHDKDDWVLVLILKIFFVFKL